MIFHICIRQRYLITNSLSGKIDIAVKWNPTTFSQPEPVLEKLRQQVFVVNYFCNDLSKSNIAEIFKQAFGYELKINPLTFAGKCVQKSNLNAQHDGQIIECPITQVKPECVYQLLIDNETEDGFALDLRLPVFKDCLPFVLKKYLPVDGRFHANPVKLVVAETASMISLQEQEKILAFCRLLGLDYGELDVLRDRNTGLLYIVDANTTPHGLPFRFALHREGIMPQVVQRQAEAFSRVLMDGL